MKKITKILTFIMFLSILLVQEHVLSEKYLLKLDKDVPLDLQEAFTNGFANTESNYIDNPLNIFPIIYYRLYLTLDQENAIFIVKMKFDPNLYYKKYKNAIYIYNSLKSRYNTLPNTFTLYGESLSKIWANVLEYSSKINNLDLNEKLHKIQFLIVLEDKNKNQIQLEVITKRGSLDWGSDVFGIFPKYKGLVGLINSKNNVIQLFDSRNIKGELNQYAPAYDFFLLKP